jgi:3-hydroxyacyl-CoA dehydrogenase
MKRFVHGFLLNRMQAALVREAVDLVASGVAGVEALDAVIRDGLGLRWALMGPFGVANTNADGGIREYFTRFRTAYHGLWDALSTRTRFSDELVEQLGQETDAMTGGVALAEQRTWRDRMVDAIREVKAHRPLLPAEDKKRKKRVKRDRKQPVTVEEPRPEQEVVAAAEPEAKPRRRHGKKRARRERRQPEAAVVSA